jgi:N-methyltransferase StaMA
VSATGLSTVEDTGGHYDQMGALIEIMGGNQHVGYWNDEGDRTPLLEAINRLTDIIGSKLDLRPGEYVIDIGCGAGVPAIRLGQRVEAQIVGVTNSNWQVQDGNQRIRAAGLRGQLEIEFGDAAALAHPDDTFDAALMFQSLQHANDQAQWLREMIRVLRPGGRVVLTEFTAEIDLTDQEADILRAGAMQPPLRYSEVLDLIRANGTVIDDVVECGDRIRPSYAAYFNRLQRYWKNLVEMYGEERVSEQRAAMSVILPVYRDKIGYLIITGHKAQ